MTVAEIKQQHAELAYNFKSKNGHVMCRLYGRSTEREQEKDETRYAAAKKEDGCNVGGCSGGKMEIKKIFLLLVFHSRKIKLPIQTQHCI